MWGFVLFCSLLFSGKRRDVETGNEEALLKNEEKNVGAGLCRLVSGVTGSSILKMNEGCLADIRLNSLYLFHKYRRLYL